MYLKFPKEQRDQIIAQLKDFFYNERDEEIGDLAAENFLHFVTKNIGPHYYNQGIKDAARTVEEKSASLEEDLHSLERPIDWMDRKHK